MTRLRDVLGLCAGIMIVPSLAIMVPAFQEQNVHSLLIVAGALIIAVVLLLAMLALTVHIDETGTYSPQPRHRGRHRA